MPFGGALALDGAGCCEDTDLICSPCNLPRTNLTLTLSYWNTWPYTGGGFGTRTTTTLTLYYRTGTAGGYWGTYWSPTGPYWYTGRFQPPDFCLPEANDCPPYDTQEHAIILGCNGGVVLLHLIGASSALSCLQDDGMDVSWPDTSCINSSRYCSIGAGINQWINVDCSPLSLETSGSSYPNQCSLLQVTYQITE